MLPNTRLPLNPTLRVLSYNIRTRFLSLGPLNTSLPLLTLYPSLTERQHYLLVKKNCQALSIKSILTRRKNPSHLSVSKPTGILQTYHPFVDVLYTSFNYQPCATDPLVVCLCRGTAVVLKTSLRVERSS